MAEKKESAEATARTIRRVTRKKCIVSARVRQVGGPAKTHFFGPDGQGGPRDPGSDVRAGCRRVGQPARGVAWREHMLLLGGRPPNGLELSCPAEAANSPLLYGTPARQVSPQSTPSPPGQSKILVISQGFSEVLSASLPGTQRRQGLSALESGCHTGGAARSPQVSSFRQ
jgi:hypothetical protein